VAFGWLHSAFAVGQTFLSAGETDSPVRWIGGCGDWKVATTGRLASPPYFTIILPAHTLPVVAQT
jgi:hypothetical protein